MLAGHKDLSMTDHPVDSLDLGPTRFGLGNVAVVVVVGNRSGRVGWPCGLARRLPVQDARDYLACFRGLLASP